jgi:dTDP-glucose 4,6-dehydratase
VGYRITVKLLITGGAGFVGSHLASGILSGTLESDLEVEHVTVIGSQFNSTPPDLLTPHLGAPRLTFRRGELRDMAFLTEVLDGVGAVIHLAGSTHVDRSLLDPVHAVDTNVIGSLMLLQASAQSSVQRFIQVSTQDVYGDARPGKNKLTLSPRSPYAASKAAADLIATSYHLTQGLDVVITRSHNNYGPGQLPEKLIPKFISRLLLGLPVQLYGDGLSQNSWIHVTDHCRAIMLALTKGTSGHIYNIPGSPPISNLELTRCLIDLTGRGHELIEHIAARPGVRSGPPNRDSDPPPGYVPSRPLHAGLAETVTWFRAHPEWWNTRSACSSPHFDPGTGRRPAIGRD